MHELTRKDLLKKNLGRYTCLGSRMAVAFCLQVRRIAARRDRR